MTGEKIGGHIGRLSTQMANSSPEEQAAAMEFVNAWRQMTAPVGKEQAPQRGRGIIGGQ